MSRPNHQKPVPGNPKRRHRSAADIKPAANLLEILHARALRERINKQLLRLDAQACATGWGLHNAEFDPLFWDAQSNPTRDPLNTEEVRGHYVDMLVAMDHLLEQLGEFPVEA